jgi:glycosyltransferase involved in cell wall biosynthesis
VKLLHIITTLDQGGAEAALHRLVSASSGEATHSVVSLRDDGIYAPLLRDLGVPVYSLKMPSGTLTIMGLIKLYRIIRASNPDVIQTWMYHADLVGGIVARFAGFSNVVWGVRHTNLERQRTSFSARMAARLCALLSYLVPAAITCNSQRSASVHQAIGYQARKFVVIPNGLDLNIFYPDKNARVRVRKEWSLGSEETLLGFVARWHPQKDHVTLLRALSKLKHEGVDFRCALVGAGIDSQNAQLMATVREQGLMDRLILAGPRNDIPSVMNALDLHVLASAGEGFPNVVAEAMACGTPCLVTDVGDAAFIVGDTGWVVRAEDAVALAATTLEAIAALRRESRDSRGSRCRNRIVKDFGIEVMAASYLALWRKVARMDNC